MVSKRLPVPPNPMLLSPAPTSPPGPFLHTFSDLTERLLEPLHIPECEQCEQGWAAFPVYLTTVCLGGLGSFTTWCSEFVTVLTCTFSDPSGRFCEEIY